jgi:uncharacterized membrane protein (UPF0127 family)
MRRGRVSKRQSIQYILFFVLLLLTITFGVAVYAKAKKPYVFIDNHKIYVKILDNPEERAKGFSDYKKIKSNSGMLFIHGSEDYRSYWMKDMNFSIDIIWITEDRRVIGVEEYVMPSSYPITFDSPAPSKYVLEVKAGVAEKVGIKPGDYVDLSIR